jgi:hypothetical protein
MPSQTLIDLQQLLAGRDRGRISDPDIAAKVENLLANCWDEMHGWSEKGMEPYKLIGRTENLYWHPPSLLFDIARHGAAALGSIYAEVQEWVVDLSSRKAECSGVRRRRIAKAQPRYDAERAADQLCEAIRARADHAALKWAPDRNRVTIRTGQLLPAEGQPQQTLIGRRKRLGAALRKRLEADGWQLVPKTSPHTYRREP